MNAGEGARGLSGVEDSVEQHWFRCFTPQMHEDVSVGRAVELLQTADVQALDIRTPQEYEEGRLKDAVLVNFYSGDFVRRLSELDRSRPYLLYCEVGGRSKASLDAFKQLGFQRIYHLRDGFGAWLKQGLPVEK